MIIIIIILALRNMRFHLPICPPVLFFDLMIFLPTSVHWRPLVITFILLARNLLIFGNSENIPSWLSVKCFLGDFKIIIYLVLLHLPTPILQILLGLCLCDHHWLLISGGNSLSVTILFFHVMHNIAAWLLFRPLMVVMYFAVCLTASILNLMTPWLFLAFFISQVHVLLPLQRSLRQLRMISITIKHMCRKSLGLIVTSTQSFFTANCSSYGLLTSTKAGWSLVFLAKLGWCC